jgi:2,3-bisphosphoglycerate-independent phosphoglycerate mutase
MDVRIPSPKGIPFDQKPELSLPDVANRVISGIKDGFDLIVTNFANGDVIGHTANLDAKVKCAEVVDQYLGEVIRAAEQAGYVILVTADHGNLEETITEEGGPHVSHTANPVRFFLVDPKSDGKPALKDGRLADVAPTLLRILGVPVPSVMTGEDLSNGFDFGSGRKAILIILDGWGVSTHPETDPIAIAATPCWDEMQVKYAHSLLQASGEAVGLKPGKAGNSEAGHMNMGAGRVVLQDDVRLDRAMKDGTFYQNPVILETIDHVNQKDSSLHLIGLLTEKSSHGAMDYPLAILKMARDAGLEKVFLHMIFDGRSTEPGSAPQLLEKLESEMDKIGLGMVVTGIGRGIALDRDGNYQKTQKAYDALVFGKGRKVAI